MGGLTVFRLYFVSLCCFMYNVYVLCIVIYCNSVEINIHSFIYSEICVCIYDVLFNEPYVYAFQCAKSIMEIPAVIFVNQLAELVKIINNIYIYISHDT